MNFSLSRTGKLSSGTGHDPVNLAVALRALVTKGSPGAGEELPGARSSQQYKKSVKVTGNTSKETLF